MKPVGADFGRLGLAASFNHYWLVGEHYAGARRSTPAFLATFSFQGVPAAASLLRAIDMLRHMMFNAFSETGQ
jgi:hypothetical protein